MFQRPFLAPVTKLNQATAAGDLAAAYDALRRLSLSEAQSAALAAGYAVAPGTTPAAKTRFWRDMQDQIAEAVRLKTDGFGLQLHRKKAA